MSKEEIIKYIQEEIENETDTFHWFDNTPNNKTRKDIEKSIQAHQGLLDLYNQTEKELDLKNKVIDKVTEEIEILRQYFDESSQPDFIRILEILRK